MKKIFLFDLDGTVTRKEALPIIAAHFSVTDDILKLTRETINGNIPFVESFIRRVHIMKDLPVDGVSRLLSEIPFYEGIKDFIILNSNECCITTGNLDVWIDKLVSRLNCMCYSSIAEVRQNKVIKLVKILSKDEVVANYKNNGYFTIYIGEGNNDAEAMRLADISIASGLTHEPAKSVLELADYVVYSEEALCRLIKQL